MIAFVSNRPYLKVFFDPTRVGIYTLNPVTQEALKKMDDGPLEITYYINLLDEVTANNGAMLPSSRAWDYREWQKYQAYKSDIKIKFEYYYNYKGGEAGILNRYPGLTERQIAEKVANVRNVPIRWFKSPDKMDKELDLAYEEYHNVALLRYQGKSTFLRLYPSPPNAPGISYLPDETEICPALNRLVGIQPVIHFSSGNGELDPYGYGVRGMKRMLNAPLLKYAMINQGIDSDTITIDRRLIPDSGRVLAVCAPLFPFSVQFVNRFDEYLNDGRNIFIGIGPDNREILDPLLQKLGLRTKRGILGRQNSKVSGEQVSGILTDAAKDFSKSIRQYIEKETYYRNDSLHVELTRAVGLEIERDAGFKVEPFIVLDTLECFNRPDAKSIVEMEGLLQKRPTDEVGPFAVGYKLTRHIGNKEQRVIVMGNMNAGGSQRNIFYALAPHIFGWLVNDKYPVDLLKPEPLDKTFDFKLGTVKTRKLFWLYFMTGGLVLVASVVLIRRMRK